MYGNQKNYARVFQLKKDIAHVKQEGKSFVQHLGNIKTMWNELDVYLPHTTDASILLKKCEEILDQPLKLRMEDTMPC